MWAIQNDTGFAAERTFVRDKNGAEIFLVAIRGTFDFDDQGRINLAEEQVPVAEVPAYHGEIGKSSMRWDTDLPRTKNGTDVLVNGSAYAFRGKPAKSVETTIRVGSIFKKLTVFGNRQWQGRAISDPEPFITMPISYERALGGIDSEENPLGVGSKKVDGNLLPNVVTAGENQVAGYGAISGNWQPRRGCAGTYNDQWENNRKPLIPEDFDDDFFYSAPQDQRAAGFLRGGEEVELINLTPNGRVRFRLPRITLGLTSYIDNDIVHHRAQLHTVIIEPDDQKLMLVWHSSLPCHHTLYSLKKCVVFEKTLISSSGQVV